MQLVYHHPISCHVFISLLFGSEPMKLPYDWVNKDPLTSYDFGYHLGPYQQHIESRRWCHRWLWWPNPVPFLWGAAGWSPHKSSLLKVQSEMVSGSHARDLSSIKPIILGTMWGPQSIAKLVNITTISLGFMVVITIVRWGVINQLITFGGLTLYQIESVRVAKIDGKDPLDPWVHGQCQGQSFVHSLWGSLVKWNTVFMIFRQ